MATIGGFLATGSFPSWTGAVATAAVIFDCVCVCFSFQASVFVAKKWFAFYLLIRGRSKTDNQR